MNALEWPPLGSIPAHTYNGWFIGGGTEISLSGFFGVPLPPGLFLRSEYRFSNAENMKPYVQTIWTALVYRFG